MNRHSIALRQSSSALGMDSTEAVSEITARPNKFSHDPSPLKRDLGAAVKHRDDAASVLKAVQDRQEEEHARVKKAASRAGSEIALYSQIMQDTGDRVPLNVGSEMFTTS